LRHLLGEHFAAASIVANIMIAWSTASLALGTYYLEVNIAGNLLHLLLVPRRLSAGEVTIGPIGDNYYIMF
jgi:hypothetical protein